MATNILLVIPAYGSQISLATFQTTHALIPALGAKGIGGGITTFSYPEIGEARNIALTGWYDTCPDASHMLFIDADMGFSPQVVIDMLLFDEPIVGALYSRKTLPIQWAASGMGENHEAKARGPFMEVEGIGMGCCLIRRDCVTTMLEKMPELIDTRLEFHAARDMLPSGRIIRAFDPLDGPRGRLSEDLAFCQRWRDCGGEIWASVGHDIEHVGNYSYKANYMQYIADKQVRGAVPQLAAE